MELGGVHGAPAAEGRRQRYGNGKVAVITLAKAVVGDEAADSLEACFVHLSSYIDFPEELRAVFKSDDVCAVPRSHANRRVFTR